MSQDRREDQPANDQLPERPLPRLPMLAMGRAVRPHVDARWTDWRRLLLSVAKVEGVDLTIPLFDVPDDAVQDGNGYEIGLRALGVAAGEVVASSTARGGER